MTDTGRIPDEALPDHPGEGTTAASVRGRTAPQPGPGAPAPYPDHAEPHDDDQLLMPGSQGAWIEGRSGSGVFPIAPAVDTYPPVVHTTGAPAPGPAPVQPGEPTGSTLPPAAPAVPAASAAPAEPRPTAPAGPAPVLSVPTSLETLDDDEPPNPYEADAPVTAEPPTPIPAAQAPVPEAGPETPRAATGHEPGPHETAGRDSASVEVSDGRAPGAHPAPGQGPGAPRRPLHLGPPTPDTASSPVRSLADRGPAGSRRGAVKVRRQSPQAEQPDAPEQPEPQRAAAPLPGPQLAEIPPQAGAPWGPPPASGGATPGRNELLHPVGTAPQGAQTVPAAQVSAPAATTGVPVTDGPPAPALPAETPSTAAAEQQPSTGTAVRPDGDVPDPLAPVAPVAPVVEGLPTEASTPAAGAQPVGDPTEGRGVRVAPAAQSAAPVSVVPMTPAPDAALAAVARATGTFPIQDVLVQEAPAQEAPVHEAPVHEARVAEAPAPVGEFVPVAGSVPSTPHLAPTPPHALVLPPQQEPPVPVAPAVPEAPAPEVTAGPEAVAPAPVAPVVTPAPATEPDATPAAGPVDPQPESAADTAEPAADQPATAPVGLAPDAVEPAPAPVQDQPAPPPSDAVTAPVAVATAEPAQVAPDQPQSPEATVPEAEPATAETGSEPVTPEPATPDPVAEATPTASADAAAPEEPSAEEPPAEPAVAVAAPEATVASAAGPDPSGAPETPTPAQQEPPTATEAPTAPTGETAAAPPAEPHEPPAEPTAPAPAPAPPAAAAADETTTDAPAAEASVAPAEVAEAPEAPATGATPNAPEAPAEPAAEADTAAPAEAQSAPEAVAAPEPASAQAPADQAPPVETPAAPVTPEAADVAEPAEAPAAPAGPEEEAPATDGTDVPEGADVPEDADAAEAETPAQTPDSLPTHSADDEPGGPDAGTEADTVTVSVQDRSAALAGPAATPAPAEEQAPEPAEPAGPADQLAPADPVVPEAPRAARPAAPGYDEAEREAVLRVMRERRDIRNGFRSDPIPHEVLLRVLEAAHTAPSVGHSQPWDFVVIRSDETRQAMHELAARQRDAYAKSLPKGRAKQFKELKIEAILDTPVNIVVTADPTRGGRHTLGRHTQPQMAPYSSALAVENLWLAARAEGLGVGWVSFFDEREMVRALDLPEHLEVVAYLCVGYVDEFPEEPELAQAGWSQRRPLSWVVHEETYGRRALPGEEPHDLLAETVAGIRPLDAKALGEAWERQKRMTKPAGALGMLEIISAQLSGLSRVCPPPIPEPAAVAVFAGDHGVHAQGVTPWPQEVTGQMVANFLSGGAVCNAFAQQVGAEVCVIDVGVASDLPASPGLLPRKVRAGTADMTTGPALTREEVTSAIEVGIETARDLVAAGNKALLTGEMGIANTTASAALISVYTGADPAEVTGRGTGINDETLARKTDVVRRALQLHQPDPADPIGVLAAVGGLEHAALVGLVLGGASLRTPVILDGVSAGAAALVARAIAPEALAACIAGHRSAEPGHVAALNKLGLRPLVDLDLRLGEGTGALLALPLVQSAARAMHEVATFDSAGVTEK
ncbi:nicotinate-nucleotide--dimethylbenzimidazole phosphoribosyltransferase [Streptomyces sp. NPDC059816]|uniref:nicotinate-nucleotide--dimethylbenzimidazole phosphoribosyltransferase n=1 Tax=Streptomyces sp. NPDC059816 TaxID=3346960 RepID=UPI0036661494